MKTIIAPLCVFLLILFGSAAAVAGQPVTIDASSGGVEITAPDEFIFHNVLSDSTYYYGTFKWNPRKKIWYMTDFGIEDPTFSAQEYDPFEVGRSWTYNLSTGGSNTFSITGTEEICGQTCFRQDSSDGTISYWINDETGVFTTRRVNADGSYTDFCPPMRFSSPQLYLGMHSLEAFYDATFYFAPGVPGGTLDGWSSFACKGLEDVTVPAGTFPDCVRSTFVITSTTSDGSYTVRTEETWHAQGIGIVRRVQVEAYGVGGFLYYTNAQTYDLASYTIP